MLPCYAYARSKNRVPWSFNLTYRSRARKLKKYSRFGYAETHWKSDKSLTVCDILPPPLSLSLSLSLSGTIKICQKRYYKQSHIIGLGGNQDTSVFAVNDRHARIKRIKLIFYFRIRFVSFVSLQTSPSTSGCSLSSDVSLRSVSGILKDSCMHGHILTESRLFQEHLLDLNGVIRFARTLHTQCPNSSYLRLFFLSKR